MSNNPHPIDILVGGRVREVRQIKGISQERLAAPIGVTFQQVQKYEKGTNRISVSKLFEIAKVLGVETKVFFEDLPEDGGDLKSIVGISAEAFRLAQEFDRVPKDQRPHIVGLVRSLAKSEGTAVTD